MLIRSDETEQKRERLRLVALYTSTLNGRLTADEESEMRRLEDKQRGRERGVAL